MGPRRGTAGTLCVDELHLGCAAPAPATDPLQDLPVAFALVASNDKDHMRRFLKNLRTWGLVPEVVVTDGSNLYPAILAELWPDARHQLCVFHTVRTPNRAPSPARRRRPSPSRPPLRLLTRSGSGYGTLDWRCSPLSRPSGITWRISRASSPTMTRSISNCKIRVLNVAS